MDIHCDDVRQFLQELSPIGERFCDPTITDSIVLGFRGHANASWLLYGQSVREVVGATETVTNRALVLQELGNLETFFWAADELGFALPEDSQGLREDLLNTRALMSTVEHAEWPPPKLWSIAALAQHYGIATRLLDWSFDPYVAAYFAAREAASWFEMEGFLLV